MDTEALKATLYDVSRVGNYLLAKLPPLVIEQLILPQNPPSRFL